MDGSDKCGLITETTDKVKESAVNSWDKPKVHVGNSCPKWTSAHVQSASTFPGQFWHFPSLTTWHRCLFVKVRCALCILTKEAKQVQGPSRVAVLPGKLHATGGNALLRLPQGCSVPNQAVQVNWSLTPTGTFLTTMAGSISMYNKVWRKRKAEWATDMPIPPRAVSRQPSPIERQEMKGLNSQALAGVMLPGINPSSSTY